jgi:iron complex outermembrane receptor protein
VSGPALAAEIEEIVVTARGVEQSVRDIPVAISVVSEERMANLNLKSLEDIAEVTPQLNIVRASSGSG